MVRTGSIPEGVVASLPLVFVVVHLTFWFFPLPLFSRRFSSFDLREVSILLQRLANSSGPRLLATSDNCTSFSLTIRSRSNSFLFPRSVLWVWSINSVGLVITSPLLSLSTLHLFVVVLTLSDVHVALAFVCNNFDRISSVVFQPFPTRLFELRCAIHYWFQLEHPQSCHQAWTTEFCWMFLCR